MSYWRRFLLTLCGLAGGTTIGLLTVRFGAAATIRWLSKRIMTEPYLENLFELLAAGSRTGLVNLAETNLRAEYGQPLLRPFGGPKKFPDFEALMFNIAQLHTLPTPANVPVDTRVTIGPAAARPLHLQIPLIISGMAYGFALSREVKIALARAASMTGTATNTGEGPFLPEERQAATKLILQYNRGHWSKTRDILRQADAIEIQLGQGARTGIGRVDRWSNLSPELRHALGLLPGKDAITHARPNDLTDPRQLYNLIESIRRQSNGIPVGVKIAAGKFLEQDIALAAEAGVDFITVDGAQGATYRSMPTLQDDFGLPHPFAVHRAASYLKAQKLSPRISLIVSGGLKTPGDYLKALALGADAVAIGTTAIFALTHTQVLKTLPFEPPLRLITADGSEKHKFDPDQAARNLANYLVSCVLEMQEAVRALGKTALHLVDRHDLFTWDPFLAEALGINLCSKLPPDTR